MEPIPKKICMICLENQTPSELIVFSCNHAFCTKCMPYFLLNSLRIHSPKFLFESQCSCPLCSTGFAVIPSEKILQSLVETTGRTCSECNEQLTVNFCIDCNKTFCDDCSAKAHQTSIFQSHKLTNLGQSMANPQFKCICTEKHLLSHICLSCERTICSFCLKLEHVNHKVIPIEEFAQINPEIFEAKFKIIHENNSNLMKSIESGSKQFNNIIDEVVDMLQNLKKKNMENVLKAESQMDLANSVLLKVQQDINHSKMHF